VNLSEVYQKSLELGKLPLAQAIVHTASLQIVPFSESLALRAAEIHQHTKKLGISFADRACLALGVSEGLPVLTGDRQWLKLSLDVVIESFRPES
jgi:PIN domain nuclease of toxin-antitoxin system